MGAKLAQFAAPFLSITLIGVCASNASAQIPALQPGILAPGSKNGPASSGGGKTAAEVRLQTQMQQRIQVQAQVLQRAQTQAQRGTQTALRATEQRVRSSEGLKPNVEAKSNLRGQALVGNSEAIVRADAQTNGRMAHQESEIDVGLFDSVFGRFNPFRGTEPAVSTTLASTTTSATTRAISRPDSAPQQTASSPKKESQAPNDAPASQGSLVGQTATTTTVSGLDLSSRVQHAIRLRRAEIAEVRDQAVTTSNVQLLVRADEMESVLNTFVSAQADAAAQSVQRGAVKLKGRTNASLEAQSQVSAAATVTASAPQTSSTSLSSGTDVQVRTAEQPSTTQAEKLK